MGNLLKETPYSEITATIEALQALGVERRHFEAIRKDPARASAAAQAIIAGYILVDPAKTAAPAFSHDKTKDGWTCLERGTQRITSIDQIRALSEVSFLEKGESYVNGEVMLERAKERKLDFSQYDAEYLLKHQSEIPKELRSYYFTFPGTVWRDGRGRRRVDPPSGVGLRDGRRPTGANHLQRLPRRATAARVGAAPGPAGG